MSSWCKNQLLIFVHFHFHHPTNPLLENIASSNHLGLLANTITSPLTDESPGLKHVSSKVYVFEVISAKKVIKITIIIMAHSLTPAASQQSAGRWSVVDRDRAEITWSNEAESDYIRSNRDKMLHFTLHCPLCPQPSDR